MKEMREKYEWYCFLDEVINTLHPKNIVVYGTLSSRMFDDFKKSTNPVCGNFEFEPLTWEDIYCGETPSDVYCMSCGWHYSPEQEKFPELANGANTMSLKEYRGWYAEKIAVNPNYSYFEEMTENYVPTPHKCPVCGKYEFADESCYDICPFCGWVDDGVHLSDPDFVGGANELSLKHYRKEYHEKITQDPTYRGIST